MKEVNRLLKHFDSDTGKFENINLEKVSIVQTYSQIEGLGY